nr:hypothetical protein [Morchella crassipes]
MNYEGNAVDKFKIKKFIYIWTMKDLTVLGFPPHLLIQCTKTKLLPLVWPLIDYIYYNICMTILVMRHDMIYIINPLKDILIIHKTGVVSILLIKNINYFISKHV